MGEPPRVRVTGPLEPFAAGFIVELAEVGYRPAAAAVQVRVLAHLSRWMQEQDVSAEDLRERELESVPARASCSGGERPRRRDDSGVGSSPFVGGRARL